MTVAVDAAQAAATEPVAGAAADAAADAGADIVADATSDATSDATADDELADATAADATEAGVKTCSATDDGTHESLFSPGKAVLYVVLGLFFYAWWDLLGWVVLPVLLYALYLILPLPIGRHHSDFETRMEVRTMVILELTLASVPVLLLWMLLRGGPLVAAALALYVAWSCFVDDAPRRGGRFWRPLRRTAYWRHFAAYFPMSLTRTAPLDPKGNYVFGYHPHGIISVGALCNFATEATGFDRLFPGIDLRLLTLSMNFRVPFFREYLLGLGVNDVTRASCERNLRRGPGASIMIVVGGARESLETNPRAVGLVLEGRKGFVKVAIRAGASLVPVFSFGENDVFGVYHNEGLHSLQLRMQKRMGFAVPVFFGRALTGGLLHRVFGLNVGVMPLRTPVHAVVGRPIPTEQADNPTQEQIDAVHARYTEELERVYREWKGEWEKEVEAARRGTPQERQEVQKDERFHLERKGTLTIIE